ncbi:uncharacterized protein LTHEOB_11795 [Neofusicoccum parvum]|nr:uncharacterized protein LTHEOB_11795 [Neofusicoccum parvum]
MASPALHHAIQHAHLERLQTVLLALCNESPSARQTIEQHLLVPAEHDDDHPAAGDEPNSAPSQPDAAARPKRQRARYATCKACHQEFDVTKNAEGACRSHDGALEPRDDDWPDHDEDCHGPIDTQENIDEHPERFEWDCCERPADGEGCVGGRHVVDEEFRPVTKKRKMWPSWE